MARQTWKLASEKAICQHGGDNTTHVVEWEPNKSQKIQHVKDTTSSFCFIVKRMSGKQLGSFSYICARYGVHSLHQKCREQRGRAAAFAPISDRQFEKYALRMLVQQRILGCSVRAEFYRFGLKGVIDWGAVVRSSIRMLMWSNV